MNKLVAVAALLAISATASAQVRQTISRPVGSLLVYRTIGCTEFPPADSFTVDVRPRQFSSLEEVRAFLQDVLAQGARMRPPDVTIEDGRLVIHAVLWAGQAAFLIGVRDDPDSVWPWLGFGDDVAVVRGLICGSVVDLDALNRRLATWSPGGGGRGGEIPSGGI